MRTPDLLLLLTVRASWASWRAREGPTFPISSSGLCHTVLQLLVSEAGCCGQVRFGNLNFMCFQLSFSILHNILVFLTTLSLSESWGGGTLGHSRLLTQYHRSCCWSFRFYHLKAHYFVTGYLSRLWAVNSAHLCLTAIRSVCCIRFPLWATVLAPHGQIIDKLWPNDISTRREVKGRLLANESVNTFSKEYIMMLILLNFQPWMVMRSVDSGQI